MVRPNYYFRMLTALTLTAAAAAVLAVLLIASGPASAQEDCSAEWNDYIQPDCHQTGVPLDTNVWVVTGALDPTTVNTSTFTLVKQGTTTPVPASVTYYESCSADGLSYCTVELDPQSDLEANTTYTATLKGGENGVKDAYSGTPMSGDFSWSFTTGDSTAPPETTITSAPCLKQVGNDIYWWSPCETTTTSASFAFSSSKADSTFECSLDGAAFTSCTSPQSYSGLSDGRHTFQVRATNTSGNTDPTPALESWTVDATAPTISITSPADGATYQQGASIYASYSCSDSVDSSPQCTGTVPNGSAIDTSTIGTKTFTVTARDSGGNTNGKMVTYYVTKSGNVRGNR